MDATNPKGDFIKTDALIVGGGVAGLFLLDALVRRGVDALLIEADALGAGQTTSSQGILHAGVKYSLGGLVGDDAAEASEAAELWERRLLAAELGTDPALAGVQTLSPGCHLWRSEGLVAAAAFAGARLALKTRPELVAANARPSWLLRAAGEVLSLPERVIDPQSLLRSLATHHLGRIARAQVASIARNDAVCEVGLSDQPAKIRAAHLYLCAGAGNEDLARLAAISVPMQRRPLRQAMVRGALPIAFGHCIDGAKTRVTITSDRLGSDGEVVWHVGGQIAEDGVAMTPANFRDHALRELRSALGGFDFADCKFASYLVNRAEPQTKDGRRPPRAVEVREGRVSVIWPVKLVLAPRIAEEIAMRYTPTTRASGGWPLGMPIPECASRPWEQAEWESIS